MNKAIWAIVSKLMPISRISSNPIMIQRMQNKNVCNLSIPSCTTSSLFNVQGPIWYLDEYDSPDIWIVDPMEETCSSHHPFPFTLLPHPLVPPQLTGSHP